MVLTKHLENVLVFTCQDKSNISKMSPEGDIVWYLSFGYVFNTFCRQGARQRWLTHDRKNTASSLHLAIWSDIKKNQTDADCLYT